MFSYGSGSTATMFSLRLCENQSPFILSNIASVMDIGGKLKARHEVEHPLAEFISGMLNH